LVGHGIGLEVHEAPYLCRGYQEPIKKGMCFTVEPRIWKPYEFCVRTEDVVVVGEERGHRLTNFTYDPQIID
jgi:Xaa-Pro aminopeptidase